MCVCVLHIVSRVARHELEIVERLVHVVKLLQTQQRGASLHTSTIESIIPLCYSAIFSLSAIKYVACRW